MDSNLVVLKYGSSVLADHESLPAVVHDIYRYYRRGCRVLVVVSAIGAQTDQLLGMARRVTDPPAPEEPVAELLATGERQSAALLVMTLHRAGIGASLVTPGLIGLTLRGERLDASPVSVDVEAVAAAFQGQEVLVVPGFAGLYEGGGTALLGRGGSDLTAAFLARELDAAECRLVKDVDGIYERDPASVPGTGGSEPGRYAQVTYADALRVAGCLVQAKAIEFMRDRSLAVDVCGLLNEGGTRVGASSTRRSTRSPASPKRLLLLGLGNVGQGVYAHLQRLASRFAITGVLVRDLRKEREFPAPGELIVNSLDSLLDRPYDLVVDVCGDKEVARTAIEHALGSGRSAVTASKSLIADQGPQLEALSRKTQAQLRYSAAVGGSVPMLECIERAAEAGPILGIRGVLNGTCNFVLDRIAGGLTLPAAVSEARRLGFAEADVSRDLDGDDAADKLRVLARAAYGVDIDVDIQCESLNPGSVRRTDDKVLRQVAAFDPHRGACVTFEALSRVDYLAGAQGEENRLAVTFADGREWRVKGKGAGRWPTAEAVIADILDVVRASTLNAASSEKMAMWT